MMVVQVVVTSVISDILVVFNSRAVSNILAQAACVRHACLHAPCVAWPLLLPSFSLSLSPHLLLFLRLLLLTQFGETPVCKIIFAPIFWHN